MYYTINRLIAVEPIKDQANTVKLNRGFATIEQKMGLIPLVVVFPTSGTDYKLKYCPGDTLLVIGDVVKHISTGVVYEADGKKFVLVSEDHVRLVKPLTVEPVAVPPLKPFQAKPQPVSVPPSESFKIRPDGGRS